LIAVLSIMPAIIADKDDEFFLSPEHKDRDECLRN